MVLATSLFTTCRSLSIILVSDCHFNAVLSDLSSSSLSHSIFLPSTVTCILAHSIFTFTDQPSFHAIFVAVYPVVHHVQSELHFHTFLFIHASALHPIDSSSFFAHFISAINLYLSSSLPPSFFIFSSKSKAAVFSVVCITEFV